MPGPTSTGATRTATSAARRSNAPETFAALYGLWSSDLVRVDLDAARDVVAEWRRRLDAADARGDEGAHLVEARTVLHCVEGPLLHLDGDLPRAGAALEAALALRGRPGRGAVARACGANFAVGTRFWLALDHCLRGRPDAALGFATRASALAREDGRPAARALAALALAVSLAGLELMLRQVDDGGGRQVFDDLHCCLLAAALLEHGRPDDAAAHVRPMIALATGPRRFRAEALRLDGEIRRTRGDAAGAERRFDEALALAAGQGALLLELRAATSRARLLAPDRERAAARAAAPTTLEAQAQPSSDGVHRRGASPQSSTKPRSAASRLAASVRHSTPPERNGTRTRSSTPGTAPPLAAPPACGVAGRERAARQHASDRRRRPARRAAVFAASGSATPRCPASRLAHRSRPSRSTLGSATIGEGRCERVAA